MTSLTANEDQAAVMNGEEDGEVNGGEVGTKTPPAAPASPPLSANTRASTRKRRSAAPIFGSQGSAASSATTDQTSTPSPSKLRKTGGTPKGKMPPRIDFNDDEDQKKQQNGTNKKGEDPFDFIANSDVHPEPLKNISIERSSFNEVKFTKSLPSSAERYANMEKIAASRNPQLAASLSSPGAQDLPTSLSQLSSLTSTSLRLSLSSGGGTPKSITSMAQSAASSSGRKKRGTPKSRAKRAAEEEEEEEEGEQGGDEDSFMMEMDQQLGLEEPKKGTPGRKRGSPKTPNATPNTNMLKTPVTGSRAQRSSESSVAKKKAAEEEELYRVPELTPDEQLDVDWPKEGHMFMGAGARVLALWGSEYYAAHICGREPLGRYYVHFVEDNLNRVLPPTGVFPLSVLKPGTHISFIDIVDEDEVGKVSEVVEQPPVDSTEGWLGGKFMVRELDEEFQPSTETKSVPWAKLYLTKDQAHQLQQELKQQQAHHKAPANPALNIDEENIVAESRSTRRSRGAALARIAPSQSPMVATAATPTEGNVSTKEEAKTSPRTPRARGSAKASPAASVTRSGRGRRASPRKAPTPAEQKEKDGEEEEKAMEEETAEKQIEEEVKQLEKGEETQTTKVEEEEAPVNGTAVADEDDGSAAVSKDQPPKRSSSSRTSQQHEQPQEEAPKIQPDVSAKEVQSNNKQQQESESIFAGLKFVLTSATRPNKKVTDFNKREYRRKIEDRGGVIIEDFSALEPNETAFLIADTYYRTHKYLSALSLSVPCVSYKWIQQCVAENKLTAHEPHLLPAGESSLDPNKQFEWKPLKGILMAGKRVLIYSTTTETDPGTVSFTEIWTPILGNLGATLIGIGPGEPFAQRSSASMAEKIAFCEKMDPPVDVLLGEADCDRQLAGTVQTQGGLAVSSEWVIQAIVSGALPDLGAPGGERFRYDFV